MNQIVKLLLALILILPLTQCSKSDDPKASLPKLSINDATGDEGGTAVFTVSLSQATTETVTFKYSTANITTVDADYEVVSGKTVTIAAGQTSVQIIINLIADTSIESVETFKVVLSSPEHAQLLSDVEGTGTINNKNAPYFLKVKIDGHQWTATFANDFFSAAFLDYSFAGYGTGSDFDSQLSFIFYAAPQGPKTYAIDALAASDINHVSVYYSPTFFSSGILGPYFNAQPGGQVILTKYDVVNKLAEGTFTFTGKNPATNQTHLFTEGQFRIKIEY
jgi:hypothetical protein